MSGVDQEQEQASGSRPPQRPPFGRQSTLPTYGQSESDARSASSFEVSPITPFPSSTLSNTHPSRRRSGLESVISAISPPPSGGQPDGLTRMGRESPDPDEYYRQTGLAPAPLKAGRGKMTGVRSNSMAYPPSLEEEVSGPTNRANTLDSARTRQPIPRSVSDSPTIGGPAAGASAVRPSARPRQPSFKDLVDKFNNGSDSILPIPTTATASPTSRTASPSGSEFDKDHSDTFPRRRQYRESIAPGFHTDQFRSPIDESYSRSPSSLYSPQGDAELSTAVLLPIQRQVPTVHPRKPSLGEVLTLDTQVNNNPGSGLPPHLRRRGSDGSIASANTAFLDPGNPASTATPLTPTAWYLGRANTLEAVSVNKGIGHRRSRTDLDNNTFDESLADLWNPEMAVSAPLLHLQGKPGDGSPGSPNSRSRIPVSSHRRSSGSGLDPLSPSTNPTFSNRASTIPVPPKGSSRLPKPLPGTASPPRMTEDGPASFAMTARGRRDIAAGRTRHSVPDRSKLLQAYVSAPPPKKSPPLRSSRPRYAISVAGVPTAQSPEINKRLSSLQKGSDRSNARRVRQLPELSNVDLEARRQQIQQAFARSVQENEKREEEAAAERRRTRVDMIPESVEDNQSTLSGSTNRTVLPIEMASTLTESTETGVENGAEPRNQPLLRLNTSFSLPDSSGHSSTDSLTLGLPGASPRDMSTRPDMLSAVPESAIPQSASSDHTHFDLEPQTRLIERKPSTAEAHRTLLNHIMQIRESSSSSECDDNDNDNDTDCLSEHDENESSENMRPGTTYFRNSSSVNADDTSEAAHLAQVDRPRDNRWSMSSWSSSVHNQDSSFDDDCDEEDSGDDLIVQRPTPQKEPPPPVDRTPEAAHRRASFADDEHEDSPVQADLGVTGPDTLKTQPPPQPNMFASGASLVKKGKWDSRRATQLYLEQLTQGKTTDFGLGTTRPSPRDPPVGISSPGLPPARPSSTEQRPVRQPVRQPEYVRPQETRRQDMRVPPVLPEDPKENLEDEPVVIPRYQDPRVKAARHAHTASLVGPADWEDASPSVMDWMQVAAEDEGVTPAHERPDFVNDGLRNARVPPKSQLSVTSNSLDIEQPQVGQKDQGLPVSRGTESSEDSLRRGQSERAADSSSTSLAPSADHLMRTETKRGSPSPEARRLRKRRNVIKELIDTEHTFGRDMKVVEDIYKGTSGSCLDLSPDDVRTLFANSAEIVQFSQNFQDALKQAARSIYVMPKSQRWQSKRNSSRPTPQPSDETPEDAASSDLDKDCATRVGDAFLGHIVQMEKVYAEYMKNYELANKKLQILRQNPKVDIWLTECRQWAVDLTTAWDLESLLVKPVQRILKYPLLLGELLDATPQDHPDYESIMNARTEVTNASHRINDQKKRADVVTQVIGRKSDVRSNISKAFGRRTEKFRQQVGVSDMFEDKEYDALAQSFGDGFFQLQVVMRDVESYVRETTACIDKLNDVVSAIEAIMNVSQSNYPELESKWRRFKAAVRDCVVVALPEHVAVVRETVIQPMVTLLKLHEGPQRVMKKRDKRLFDYARYTALVKRGDKPDRKTVEQGEQFIALNDTLKEELPKLYALTAKLMEACLKNFVQLQVIWWGVKQNKLKPHVDVFPEGFTEVIEEWASDYTFAEAQVLSLSIANGSLLADTLNQVNFNAAPGDHNSESRRPSVSSRRRASTANSSTHRTGSFAEDSPKHSQDLTGVSALFQSPRIDSHASSSARHNSGSSFARRFSSDSANASRNLQQVTQPQQVAAESQRSNSSSGDSYPNLNLLPALSIDEPFLSEILKATNAGGEPQTPARYSGFFSSAMPMSDNPNEAEQSHAAGTASKEPRVIFTVASLYEFNIDRSRREAGYPYLTYVAGEVFDVIGEKGELWLARNQDDATHQVGWIWEKHFAKLST